MVRRRYLTKRQRRVLDDLFKGELDEQGVLEKHKIWKAVYNRWLGEEEFAREFERRMASACREGEVIIARYAAVAAAKLVQLTESDNEETARKACLDVINFPYSASEKQKKPENRPSEVKQYKPLPPEVASRLLAVLAEERRAKEGI